MTAPARAPRMTRIVGQLDEDEAQAGLWRGIRNALLIELVLFGGVLAGALAVAWWPAP